MLIRSAKNNDQLNKTIHNWNNINVKKKAITSLKNNVYYIEINKQTLSIINDFDTYEPIAYERICL
jgi:hypothetical protein